MRCVNLNKRDRTQSSINELAKAVKCPVHQFLLEILTSCDYFLTTGWLPRLIRTKALINGNTETMWSWRAFCSSSNTIPEGTHTNYSSCWKFNTLRVLFREMMWYIPSASLCRKELHTPDTYKMHVWQYPIPTVHVPPISFHPRRPTQVWDWRPSSVSRRELGRPKNPQYSQ